MKNLSPEMQAGIAIVGSEPQRDVSSWKAFLRRSDRGKILGDEANVMHALRSAPELSGRIRFNEFFGRVEIARDVVWRADASGSAWTDDDETDLMAWLQRQEIPLRARSTVGDAVQRVAKDNLSHPVRAYLDGLEWDGGNRLNVWLYRYLAAQENRKYLAAIGTAFLISAVARIYEPGCQADHVLVLEGRQGIGKTRTLQLLGNPWTTDSLPDLHSKDAALQLAGVWLVELAELAALRRSEIEAVKGFISRRVDRYRPPYGRHAIDSPRQCVFVATTNEATYLRDPTGNRRYWPVRVQDVDFDALERDRDQLWAEAVELYREGRPWHLIDDDARLAAREQDKRLHRSELEQCVAEFLDSLEDRGITETTTRDVFTRALGLQFPEDVDKSRRLGTEVHQAIASCRWHRVGAKGRGERRRVVYAKEGS